MTATLTKTKLLKDYSTFGVGGPAREFVEVATIDQMRTTLTQAKRNGQRFFILGKGSNCLFDDAGFEGLVILNKIDFCQNEPDRIFYVGAGYSFSRLGTLTARKGWTGLEFASGIPGSVGGAVYMNAGANGGETCDTLISVDFVDTNGTLIRYKREELSFQYRSSPFQKMAGAIVAATFALNPDVNARKDQIKIVRYRQTTQPYNLPSAGCIFRNPPETSAGALIERAGLKGLRVGGAMVSSVHANFIVNTDNATAQDVLALIKIIQAEVYKSSGVTLRSEVIYVPAEEARHE